MAALCAVVLVAFLISGCSGEKTAQQSKATDIAEVKEHVMEPQGEEEDGENFATHSKRIHHEPEDEVGEDDLRVFFLYESPVGDAGWSYAHDIGRKAVENLPGVRTQYLESVLGVKYTETVLENVAKSNDLIFTTSYEYMDPTIKVAGRNPDVTFMHCSGFKRRENVGTYFGRIYQARYLTGIVAGGMSKTGLIGYVAAFPIPEVIRGINAFTLGAQSVNPDAKVIVIWTKTWFNPALEKESAEKLLERGVDILAQHQDSPATMQVAQERKLYSIGYNEDMAKYAPDAQLTAAIWNWSVLYVDIVEKVKAGTWKSEDIWWGIKEGVVDIAPFGPMVPEELAKRTTDAKSKLSNGTLAVFTGPIEDRDGRLRFRAGQPASDKELHEMVWYVKGVVDY